MRNRTFMLWLFSMLVIAAAVFCASSRALGQPPMVRVFSEFPLAEPAADITKAFITPHVVWDQACWTKAGSDPNQAAAVIAQLRARPAGFRVLRMNWALVMALRCLAEESLHVDCGAITKPDALAIWRNKRTDLAPDYGRAAPLARALAAANIQLDGVYLDVEDSVGFWNLAADVQSSILKDKTARGLMDRDLLVYTDAADMGDAGFVAKFNDAASGIRIAEIQRFMSMLALPMAPGSFTLNFDDWRTSFPCYDRGGWAYPAGRLVDGRTGNPSVYMTRLSTVGRFRNPIVARRCHPMWNSFLNHICHVRSSVAVGPTMPLLTIPESGAPDSTGLAWLNDQLIGHTLRSGVTALQVFNDRHVAAEEAGFARSIAAHYRSASTPTTVLPEVQLDTLSVTTGDLTTTYQAFCTAAGIRFSDTYTFDDATAMYVRKP